MPKYGHCNVIPGHVGSMLDSDWSRKILLRSDWLVPTVASITTSGGRVLKLFVAFRYNKGVIACHPYEKLDGQFIENFVKANSASFFRKADKGLSRLFLGDPSQNSAGVKKTLTKLIAELLSIPLRSPDLNPIENLFHSVKSDLSQHAFSQNITRESYDEFQSHEITTFLNCPNESIDKIIDSMNGCIHLIIKKKGNRIKY